MPELPMIRLEQTTRPSEKLLLILFFFRLVVSRFHLTPLYLGRKRERPKARRRRPPRSEVKSKEFVVECTRILVDALSFSPFLFLKVFIDVVLANRPLRMLLFDLISLHA